MENEPLNQMLDQSTNLVQIQKLVQEEFLKIWIGLTKNRNI